MLKKVMEVCFEVTQYISQLLNLEIAISSAPVSRKRKRTVTASQLTSSFSPKKKGKGRSKSSTKASRRSSIRKHKTVQSASPNLPLVVGNMFLKVENIDLEKLSVINVFSISLLKSI